MEEWKRQVFALIAARKMNCGAGCNCSGAEQYGTMEHYGTMAHYDRQEWRMERQLITGGKELRGMGHL